MQEITDVKVTITAPIPKYRTDVTSAGMSAITTPNINFRVVSFPCTWGDGEIFSKLLMCIKVYHFT